MDIILHQYEISPFSEKVRRILAFKRLSWHAVRAPAVMPKTDLVALTGGYRKIPVLQLGRHVYCDSALIARVLERLQPTPTLYPTLEAEIVAEWADTALFETAVAVGMRPTRLDDLMRLLAPEELSKIAEDRKAMRSDARRQGPAHEAAKGYLRLYVRRLDRLLDSGHAFLLGGAPTIADFAAYHALWFLEKVAPEPLDGAPRLRDWMQRLAHLEDVDVRPLSSEEAIRVCRDAPEEPDAQMTVIDAPGLHCGQNVSVRAIDYGRDPIEGELVLLDENEVCIRRSDPRAGTVLVHFPRLGFEIRPRESSRSVRP